MSLLNTMVCRREHFETSWYGTFAEIIPLSVYGIEPGARPNRPHRKAWEWCAIAQALDERDMLRPGRSGAGFAVGQEPLASLFAARGVQVLATDQAPGSEAADWMSSNQHADSLDAIFRPEILDRESFDARVRFHPADMRDLKTPWAEEFDFIWSSCSIEHLGGLKQGMDYVMASMSLLKPGGVSVHTTEYNVMSNDLTIESGPSVIYRKKDIEQLDYSLRSIGCGLSRCDFYSGDHPDDLNFDEPPYATTERKHIKLLLDGYIATSMILIMRKGGLSSIVER